MTTTLRTEEEVRVKADESMKMLFSLSKQPLLDLINGLFGEQYEMETAEVVQQNVEFIQTDMSVIFADWLLTVKEGRHTTQYHVEFQLTHPAAMVMRMLEYGLHIAKDSVMRKGDTTYCQYPKQLVLYLERDDFVTPNLYSVVRYPPYVEENQHLYTVPEKMFWDLRVEDLKEQLYALIPFLAFSSRKVMSEIHQDPELSPEEKTVMMNAEFQNVKETIAESLNHMLSLYSRKKITEEDLNKMSTVTVHLFRHLYDQFWKYNQTAPAEVYDMVKSMLDVEALKRAKVQAAEQATAEASAQARERAKGALLNILHAKHFAKDEVVEIVSQEQNADLISEWMIAAAVTSDYAEFKQAVMR